MKLVVSDAHTGLKQAIAEVMAEAGWQRCRVHFLRNLLARVPRGSAEMVAAAIRTILRPAHQPRSRGPGRQGRRHARPQVPGRALMLLDGREDLTAFAAFPTAYRTRIWSTNPLERVNEEIKRRTNVVVIFPDDAAVLRLGGGVPDRGPR